MILGGLVTNQAAIIRSMLPVGRDQVKQNEPFQRHRLAAKPDNLVGATPFHVWFSSATLISHHPSLIILTPRHMPLHIPLEHFPANPPSIANLYCSRQSPRINPAINRSAPHIQ